MDWFKQNKFLSGFLIVLIILGGGVGFLAFSAKAKYDQVQGDYSTKVGELKQLQGQQPYPEEANVSKMQEAQKAHQASVEALHKDLLKGQVPLKQVTPEKFQDNLRESVKRVTAKAAELNVALPKENFYMGFNAYQGVPPKPEAAAPLARMLEAMEIAVNILLDSRITELSDIKRDPLPEEGVAASTPEPPKPGARDSASAKDKDKGLLERHGFSVEFIAAEPNFRNFIDGLISSKQQFFVPASVSVVNQAEKGPSKGEAGGGLQPPPPPPTPDQPDKDKPKTPASGEKLNIIVGLEKLKASVRIEIVNFIEPVAAK